MIKHTEAILRLLPTNFIQYFKLIWARVFEVNFLQEKRESKSLKKNGSITFSKTQ